MLEHYYSIVYKTCSESKKNLFRRDMDIFKLPLILLLFATCSMGASVTPLSKLKTSLTNATNDEVDLEASRKGQTLSLIRKQRECTMEDLNKLKTRIIIALERQVEKMLKDDYVDSHPKSPSCTYYHGITMNYAIRLFVSLTVENAVSDYKLELQRP